MSSIHVDHILSDYLEGTLARPQIEKTKSHLTFCNACRQAQRDLEKNRDILSHLPQVPVPDGLEQKILTQLKEGPVFVSTPAPVKKAPSTQKHEIPKPALITGAVVAGIFLIIKMAPHFSRPQPVTVPVEVAPVVEAPVQPDPTPVSTPPAVVETPKPIVPKTPPAIVETAPVIEGLLNLQGTTSGIDDVREMVIKNNRGWKNLWKNHVKNTIPPPQLPEVDFDKNDVIVVFLGSQTSGGYSVQIGDIEETTWEGSPARIVHYKTGEPAPGMMNTMALTQPFHIISTPKYSGRTFFRKNR